MKPMKLYLLLAFILVAPKPTQAARDLVCQVLDNTANTTDTRFGNEIGTEYALATLYDASQFVLNMLDQTRGGGKRYSTVHMIVESFAAKGYPPIISTHSGNQFRVNADYLQAYVIDARAEFTGIVYRESTRIWQWTGDNTAPIGLLTGMADYMRLRAGWPSKNWPPRGSGSRWDEGFAVTANFLEYCSGLSPRFVSDLNALMSDSYGDVFFKILLGKTVDKLWEEYHGSKETPVQEPTSAPKDGGLN